MHPSHPVLKLCAALGCWLLAGWTPSLTPLRDPTSNPLAVCGSPYGELVARLIKGSLHSYWHGGVRAESEAQSEPPIRRLGMKKSLLPHPPSSAPARPPAMSWLESRAREVSELEERRTRRNSPFALTPAHRRFLDAAAGSRLRLAYQFDPGDPALYEILHHTVETHAKSPQAARQAFRNLAGRTVAQALSAHGSASAALAGAGAMLDLLNDALRPEVIAQSDPAVLAHDWNLHQRCLDRYHQILRQAREEGWWSAISPDRQREVEFYATLVERLSTDVRQMLLKHGVAVLPTR